jgi:hypothetical protein
LNKNIKDLFLFVKPEHISTRKSWVNARHWHLKYRLFPSKLHVAVPGDDETWNCVIEAYEKYLVSG